MSRANEPVGLKAEESRGAALVGSPGYRSRERHGRECRSVETEAGPDTYPAPDQPGLVGAKIASTLHSAATCKATFLYLEATAERQYVG